VSVCSVLLLPVGTGWPPFSNKSHHSRQPKSINFDHEIMEVGIIYSNLVEILF
jgi:hypothetical protein